LTLDYALFHRESFWQALPVSTNSFVTVLIEQPEILEAALKLIHSTSILMIYTFLAIGDLFTKNIAIILERSSIKFIFI